MYSGWAPDDAYWGAPSSTAQTSAPLPQPPKHWDPQLFYSPHNYAMKNMLGMAAAAQQFAESTQGSVLLFVPQIPL